MEDSNPLECVLCHEGYNEGKHCPRILSCSHTFCSDCIGRLIGSLTARKDLRCPVCRCPFNAWSKEEITVNRALLEVAAMNVTLNRRTNQETENEERGELEREDVYGATGLQSIQFSGPKYMTLDSLMDMEANLNGFIEEGRLWAYKEFQGKWWFAAMDSGTENTIHCHHLSQDKRPPNDALLIKHDDILRLLGTKSRMTFLELGLMEGESFGRVAISLMDECNYASNFYRLCAGGDQGSYAKCKLLGVWNKKYSDERIFTGDYEWNSGTGGKAVLPGVDWMEEYDKETYKRTSLEAGSVAGWSSREDYASLFFIYTRDNENPSGYPSFGKVEDGIDIIQGAILQYVDITNVVITACGIVLQRSLFSK